MRSIKCTGGLTRGRGFEENVRNLWVMSISYSAGVHESMIKLSGISTDSRDQNIDMGMKRRNCDYDHSQQFFNWFEIRNPFNMEDGNLYSLSTGLVPVYVKDPVNWDQAGIIGARVQESFDDSKFTEIKIKKKSLFVPLASLMRSMTSTDEKNPVFINTTLLLTRLAAVAEREENVEQYFNFELTHRPESLLRISS